MEQGLHTLTEAGAKRTPALDLVNRTVYFWGVRKVHARADALFRDKLAATDAITFPSEMNSTFGKSCVNKKNRSSS